MKTLDQSYNLYPVYETVEVMKLIVPDGLIKTKKDKKGYVILYGPTEAIDLLDKIFNKDPNNTPTEGHKSFFRDTEFVFPKHYCVSAHSMEFEEAIMTKIIVSKKVLIDFNGAFIEDDDNLPWYPNYTTAVIDDTVIAINDQI